VTGSPKRFLSVGGWNLVTLQADAWDGSEAKREVKELFPEMTNLAVVSRLNRRGVRKWVCWLSRIEYKVAQL
jgi:hypothetical protein